MMFLMSDGWVPWANTGREPPAQRQHCRPCHPTPETQLRDVSLGFGDKKMLRDFSYDFNKGDRIGIVGRNGVGKVSRPLGARRPCSLDLSRRVRVMRKSSKTHATTPTRSFLHTLAFVSLPSSTS